MHPQVKQHAVPAANTCMQHQRRPDLPDGASQQHAQLNIRPHNVCLLCIVLAAVADEQARLAALRAQSGALEQEKAGEFEARVRGMQDLSAALQVRFLTGQ